MVRNGIRSGACADRGTCCHAWRPVRMSDSTAAICMLAVGKPGYALAAREAVTSFLKHTDFEIYMTTDWPWRPSCPSRRGSIST